MELTPFSTYLAGLIRVPPGVGLAVDAGAGGGLQAMVMAVCGAEQVIAVERDPVACEIMTRNLQVNDLASRVIVANDDIATIPLADVDLVVSNPPTMPLAPEVPAFAVGGEVGTEMLETLLRVAADRWLSPHGSMQIVLSSIIKDWFDLQLLGGSGLRSAVVSQQVAPFRSWYEHLFDMSLEDQIERGQILRQTDGQLSEFLLHVRVDRVARGRMPA